MDESPEGGQGEQRVDRGTIGQKGPQRAGIGTRARTWAPEGGRDKGEWTGTLQGRRVHYRADRGTTGWK